MDEISSIFVFVFAGYHMNRLFYIVFNRNKYIYLISNVLYVNYFYTFLSHRAKIKILQPSLVNRAESDSGSEDRHVIGEPVVSPSEIQRQMHEFQRFQISGNEQGMYYRKIDEPNPNYYNTQKVQEKLPPAQPAAPVTVPASYWQERNVATGGFPVSAATAHEPPVYLIQTPTGMYHAPAPALRPVTSQFTGQGYYGMQRVVPEMYREQPMYNPGPQPSMQALQQQMVRPPAAAGVGIPAEQGYSPVAYEGRQMYYTTAPAGVVPPYQAVNAMVDLRQGGGSGGGGWNAEGGKFVGKGSESSSL